jgi:hypothetical protein
MSFDYWETFDASHGGVIEDIYEKGLLIQSSANMPLGNKLEIRVFFRLGNKFVGFQPLVKIVGKDLCPVEGLEAYNYKLKFLRISQYDRLKLRQFLNIRRPGKSVLDRLCLEKGQII